LEKHVKTPNGLAVARQTSGAPAIHAEVIRTPIGGWAGRLLARLRSSGDPPRRLTLVERIALAPRQSLTLVEAEGRRILVATSAEGAAAFYALDQQPRLQPPLLPRLRTRPVTRGAAGVGPGGPARVSW
jgi:hypothetical protein